MSKKLSEGNASSKKTEKKKVFMPRWQEEPWFAFLPKIRLKTSMILLTFQI